MSNDHVSPVSAADVMWPASGVSAQLGFLQGEVLTILETLMPECQQLHAARGLVKSAFRNRQQFISGGITIGATSGRQQP